MKTHFQALTLIVIAILAPACGSPAFKPEAAANPWPDDYRIYAAADSDRCWGTYNVHDPAVCAVGDTFYMFSTDAAYFDKSLPRTKPKGFLQMRKSADLVHWQFAGYAFDSIPDEAVAWVRDHNGGKGAHNIWAPYMTAVADSLYRLYYCVSAFGKNTSYIGIAEASAPGGPWKHVAPAVKTDSTSVANAIDPCIVRAADGRSFMHYGSYFGGLFCTALDSASGRPLDAGGPGTPIANRAEPHKYVIEAPETVFNPATGYYYLFCSYDPLMTTYNVRVGRSRSPEGPFTDFHGRCLADTTENFPIIMAPYRFSGHEGWVGTGHCGVFADSDGNFYMAHQGRRGSVPDMMVLHVRRMFFTPDGWPVVSPERYAATTQPDFRAEDIAGEWEIIRLFEPRSGHQAVPSALLDGDANDSRTFTLNADGSLGTDGSSWTFDPATRTLTLDFGGERIENITVFAGHDWERQYDTVLFAGLDADGRTIWGKRVI